MKNKINEEICFYRTSEMTAILYSPALIKRKKKPCGILLWRIIKNWIVEWVAINLPWFNFFLIVYGSKNYYIQNVLLLCARGVLV